VGVPAPAPRRRNPGKGKWQESGQYLSEIERRKAGASRMVDRTLLELRAVAERGDPAKLRAHYDRHAAAIAGAFGVTESKLKKGVLQFVEDSELCALTLSQIEHIESKGLAHRPTLPPGSLQLVARWLPLYVGGSPNPELRGRCVGASGVYAIRDRVERRVVYVGESHTGRLWKTLLRHFQDPSGLFEARGERVYKAKDRYDVAVWTSPAQLAGAGESAKIKQLRPRDNAAFMGDVPF
jgi:hypothetical protein